MRLRVADCRPPLLRFVGRCGSLDRERFRETVAWGLAGHEKPEKDPEDDDDVPPRELTEGERDLECLCVGDARPIAHGDGAETRTCASNPTRDAIYAWNGDSSSVGAHESSHVTPSDSEARDADSREVAFPLLELRLSSLDKGSALEERLLALSEVW